MGVKESIRLTWNRVRTTYNIWGHNLDTVGIIATSRCNSRCKICNIWRKSTEDISVELIKRILSDTPKRTCIELSGGEFLLHPQYEEILQMLSPRNYILLSNGILADELIDAVREFKVKNLALSCDGTKNTYRRVRGIDNYDNICRIVNELKDEINLTLNYCINPLNTREDLLTIKKFCESQGIDLTVGIYNTREYFGTSMEEERIDDVEDIVSGIFTANYINLYNKWHDGKLSLPCYSIRAKCTILPDGSVTLCEGKVAIVGNVAERSLREIWNSEETIRIQKQHTTCNGCWLVCHRPVDVGFAMIMKNIVPKFVLNRFIGEWDWDKI